ncbi:hypothetical protein [Streptomyces sp. NPDC088350]|uniref:hypothetical protein n=1 Tax=Streptomyces sp. NPDC088350 TaxID=3365854 RepID=UPI0038124FBC
MSRLAQRYWASLTDANVESLDELIERGRRRDGPLWRRYLASLLDIPAPGPAPGEVEGRAERAAVEEEREPPTSTVHYTLDTTIETGSVPAVARKRGWGVGSWALAAVLCVVGTVIGLSVHHTAQESVTTPIYIGTTPRQSPPASARVETDDYAWVPPKGWRRDMKTGAEVHYTSPSGDQEIVAKASLARGDLVATWKASEKNAHQGQGYRKIRLEEAVFEGWPAVLWEYTFTLKGVPWHAVLLGFQANGRTYQINTWYRPDIETQALKTYETVRASFTVIAPPQTTSPPSSPGN